MVRYSGILLCCVLGLSVAEARAQQGEQPLHIFGYFQTAFQHEEARFKGLAPDNVNYIVSKDKTNSFSLQQLNLFFQKRINRKLTVSVNFEALNNFSLSASRLWGGFSVEEAWIRYRYNARLTVKAGLLTPIFNNLNEKKDQTPVLPYVIRPLIYDESFADLIPALGGYVPQRAFLQVYGFRGLSWLKVDYAAYIGNSPNISDGGDTRALAGLDTTATVMLGGRLGVRSDKFKLGISYTHDFDDTLSDLETMLRLRPGTLVKVTRVRLGADLSIQHGIFSFESEYVRVRNSDVLGSAPYWNRFFWYLTLGFYPTETLFVYGSLWKNSEAFFLFSDAPELPSDYTLNVPTLGIAYTPLNGIRLKGQYAHIDTTFQCQEESECSLPFAEADYTTIIAVALSVTF